MVPVCISLLPSPLGCFFRGLGAIRFPYVMNRLAVTFLDVSQGGRRQPRSGILLSGATPKVPGKPGDVGVGRDPGSPRVGIFLGELASWLLGSHLCGGCAGRRAARWEGWLPVRLPPAVSAVALSPALSSGPRWPLEFFGNPKKPGQEDWGRQEGGRREIRVASLRQTYPPWPPCLRPSRDGP